MNALLAAIVAAVLKMGLDYFTSWQSAQQAAADKWNLAAAQTQLQSVLVGHQLEVTVNSNLTVPKPTTTADLQVLLGVKTAALLLCIFLCGCIRVQVTTHEYQPEYAVPVAPAEAFQGPAQLTPREQALGQYAGELKKELDIINQNAHSSNVKNGYIPPAPKP